MEKFCQTRIPQPPKHTRQQQRKAYRRLGGVKACLLRPYKKNTRFDTLAVGSIDRRFFLLTAAPGEYSAQARQSGWAARRTR